MQVPLPITLLAMIFAAFSVSPAWGEPPDLFYLDEQVYGREYEESSLPSHFNERVVAYTGARGGNASAILAGFPRPYEEVRDRLISIVNSLFGVEQSTEERHDDLVEWNEHYGKDEDLYGSYARFRQEWEPRLVEAGIHWQSYRETRILTDGYNHVRWKLARSKAVFRIIDGRDLFDRPWTVVLFGRIDSGLRFGVGHFVPIPVLWVFDFPVVTYREVEVMERVATALRTTVRYHTAGLKPVVLNAYQLIVIRDRLMQAVPRSSDQDTDLPTAPTTHPADQRDPVQ